MDVVEREDLLYRVGFPSADFIKSEWFNRVSAHLEGSGLKIPETPQLTLDRSLQSTHLVGILSELQQVARLDPSANW